MDCTRNFFLSTVMRSIAAIALIVVGVGILSTTTQAQAERSWTAAGSTGTIDDDSLAIAQFKNFAVTLQPGVNGTARIRYNITAVDGINQFCAATSSVIKTRFRNSDSTGATSRLQYELKVTNVLSGNSSTLYTFDSNGRGGGQAFKTATDTVGVDFDFAQNVYWIDATIFRSVATEFSDLGSIQIWESAGAPCP